MAQSGTPATSFNVEGDLTLAFFPGRDDAYHVRLNGDRIETMIARMLGFPSDDELDSALDNVTPDPNQPSVVRQMTGISISLHRFEV